MTLGVRLRVFTFPVTPRRLVWAAAFAAWSCGGSLTDLSPPKPVATVLMSTPALTLTVGQQQTLAATIQDDVGNRVTGTTVIWTVRDNRIVTVSPGGVVTAIAVGATQVAASSNGKSGITAVTVQPPPVASVSVSPPHVDAAVGARTTLTATAVDAAGNPLIGRAFTWSSSNAQVASVDPTGIVTAAAVGTATITATSEGKSNTATITVTPPPVATVTVTPNPLSTSVGNSTQLTATARDAAGNVLSGQTFQWSSSNTSVAMVAADGTLSAVGSGSATITATAGGKSGTAVITVSDLPVGSVTVAPTSTTINQNASQQLSATVRDASDVIVTNRVVTWTTGNSGVAIVTSTGLVTGLNPGAVTITATSEGKSGAATVTVLRIAVFSVIVTPPSASVGVGNTTTLTASPRDPANIPLGGRVVTWGSSDNNVATVSSTGVVTGVAVGSVTITATSEGKTGTATITVTP